MTGGFGDSLAGYPAPKFFPGSLVIAEDDPALFTIIVGSVWATTATYLRSTHNALPVCGATGTNPLVSLSGTYEILVTDSDNGCSVAASIEVTEDVAKPDVNQPSSKMYCEDTAIDLNEFNQENV